jgi:hypothetical protein
VARILVISNDGTIAAEVDEVPDEEYGSLHRAVCLSYNELIDQLFDTRDEAIEAAVIHVNNHQKG